MTMISQDDLMEAASSATGLSDFGNNDFEEGFEVLCKSYADDSTLTPLGEQLVRDEITGDLVGRLQVVDQLKRTPEIRESKLERPIFILGIPRTGTTTLQHLLQQDPDSQIGILARSRTPAPTAA